MFFSLYISKFFRLIHLIIVNDFLKKNFVEIKFTFGQSYFQGHIHQTNLSKFILNPEFLSPCVLGRQCLFSNKINEMLAFEKLHCLLST